MTLLNLENNLIEEIPDYAFVNLTNLVVLILSNNEIKHIGDNAFDGLPVLNLLELSGNQLKHIPAALYTLPDLFELSITENHIEYLPDDCFRGNKKLSILRLKDNPITAIGKNTFSNMPNLEELVLSEARDMTVFPNLRGTARLEKIILDRASITVLPTTLCDKMDHLTVFDLHSNKISVIPNMSNCSQLTLLNLGHNDISTLDNSPLKGLDRMKDLILAYNHIGAITDQAFVGLHKLEYLDMSHNKIAYIHPNAFASLSNLEDLNLGENKFAVLPTKGLQNLRHLKTFHNKELLEPPPFDALPNILAMALAYAYHCCAFIRRSKEDGSILGLCSNIVTSNSVSDVTIFMYYSTLSTRELQKKEYVYQKKIGKKVITEYIYRGYLLDWSEYRIYFHREMESPEGAFTFDQKITWLENPNTTGFWPRSDNQSYNYAYPYPIYPIYDDYTTNETSQGIIIDTDSNESYDELPSIFDVENMVRAKPPVDCRPMPGPFLPCDDLFGWWSLRCGVWIVFLLAVLGNGAVLFVSITSRSKMDVTRFLICNLAMSDLCMGVYLGFLAVVDASTLGEFEKYAVRWQSSPGCLVAGFLGVLSSELSVFTLVVITVERFYAISHAMQLDKRVSLKHAAYAMGVGWLVCLGIAGLPLFEISDYRKFAICLPFETENQVSLGYVCFIMIFNALSFLIIVVCYTGMFISIRGAHSWNTRDTVVAKRMALLVFTDFFCWSPIIFFSLTAAFETNFAKISLDEAKVLTIFVLPLNSCANPFLYAFFTRQFKRDCVKLCKRIEEASMSRHFPSSGIRRASNGSNRQSQNNTFNVKSNNSIGDTNNFGEASNNNSDDSDLHVKRLPLTEEEEQILQYVRSDSGICIDAPKSSPLSCASIEKGIRNDLLLVPLLSPLTRRRKSVLKEDDEEDVESGPDIILHTKEGHIFLNAGKSKVKGDRSQINKNRAKEGNCRFAVRLCHHSEKQKNTVPNVEIEPCDETLVLPHPKIAIKEQQADTCTDMFYEHSKYKRQKLVKQKFEADRSLDLGLKVDHFTRDKKNTDKSAYNDLKKCRNTYTQTDIPVQMRRLNNPGLPAEIDQRDRDKHINEWRKTSHLSFLWRNAGSYEAVVPKQKSNSLVELTRPIQDWKGAPNKRHSLTSRHEGYILLKNGSRDSAYEDEELYEFHEGRAVYVPHAQSKSSDSTKACVVIPDNKNKVSNITDRDRARRDYSVDSDEVCCETSVLLPVATSPDVGLVHKPKHSCGDESGISSSS